MRRTLSLAALAGISVLQAACMSTTVAATSEMKCATSFALHSTLDFREIPVWITPAIPSEGTFSVAMRAPLKSGQRYVPGSLRESDCLLDRMVESQVRAALVSAAVPLKTRDSRKALAALDEYLSAVAIELGNMLGEGKPAGDAYFNSLQANIAEAFEIRSTRIENPGPFLRFFYEKGLNSGNDIGWIVLLSFLKHSGADIDVDVFLRMFRNRSNAVVDRIEDA
jgi:hypothetical protein